MDSNHDNLVNFKEIVQVFDGICKGDHTKKLKLLYCLHLPGVVLPGELDADTTDGGGAEVAASAEDFFDGANKAIEATTESLREGLKLTASPTPKYFRKQARYSWSKFITSKCLYCFFCFLSTRTMRRPRA